MSPSRHPARYVEGRVGPTPRRRAAAIGALVCNTAGLALLVVLVLARPLHALTVLLWALLFLGTAFVALTSSGRRRTLATVAAGVFAVVLVGSILFWSPNADEPGWQAPLTIALFALGFGLARIALRVLPPSGVELFEVRGARTTAHGVLIINPRSGGGKAAQADLAGACATLGIDAIMLESGADLTELAEAAVQAGADALGMAGGDGSLAYVARVAAAHDLPFVCVPAGTRNHFALDVGLDRDDPGQALAAFVNGAERRIDYGLVNDRMFLNNVSLGVYAAIVEQEGYRDAKVETTLGLLPELWEQGGPWFDLRFDVPDHGHLDRAAIVQVSNNPYGSEFGRRERLDGGQLGIMTADPQRLGDLVGLTVLAAARQAERASALWSWAAPAFTVESGQGSLTVGLDGEVVSLDTPLRFSCVPAGLRLLVPAGTRVGLAEQTLGQGNTYMALFEVAFGAGGSDA